MNIHEYQGKLILRKHGVPVPEGLVAFSSIEARRAAEEIKKNTGTKSFVVKAQIHAGGRGKGGGVKVAGNIREVEKYAGEIIGMQLFTHQTGPEGKKVNKVLIEQNIYYKGENPVREYYLSILLNRDSGRNIIMYSPEGGMDIETVAENTPGLIFREEIDPGVGLQPSRAVKIAVDLGLTGRALEEMIKFSTALYKAYIDSDALLIEINPVIKTSDDLILAADAKIKLDENAFFRHKDYIDMRDMEEEDPAEIKASEYHLNFIKLDGNIGCMVNGAGLAMATMDMIKLSGGKPANFLDVGGTASADTVEAGFRIILKDDNVKVILINIFGGIVRCDRVAQGIIDAYRTIETIDIPVIVRLQGTNSGEARNLIDGSGLKVQSAVTLQEAADLVKRSV